MRKIWLYIWLLCPLFVSANDTIPIPLKMSVFEMAPQDGPTGSTPDPTDPNQFRASLTGNTLLIETQKDAVSYVVIQETESDRKGEDYFYGISFGSVACPITRAGYYTIHIGYWNTDFTGQLWVKKFYLLDFNGHFWGATLDRMQDLPAGFYILRLQTPQATTSTKFYKRL